MNRKGVDCAHLDELYIAEVTKAVFRRC